MKDKFLAFFREEEGLTTVEYAIGGALVGLAIVAAFSLLGTSRSPASLTTSSRDRRSVTCARGELGAAQRAAHPSSDKDVLSCMACFPLLAACSNPQILATGLVLVLLALAVREDLIRNRVPNGLNARRPAARAGDDVGRRR